MRLHLPAARPLRAVFRCYEDYARASKLTLRFKLENVVREERFSVRINGRPVAQQSLTLRYAPNGRDTRIHTVPLKPYQLCELILRPDQLRAGSNTLELQPIRLLKGTTGKVYLVEIELEVRYG